MTTLFAQILKTRNPPNFREEETMDINDDNQQADSEEESCESSFKDVEDYEMEDNEEFPEIN